jgi:hypothetical protein
VLLNDLFGGAAFGHDQVALMRRDDVLYIRGFVAAVDDEPVVLLVDRCELFDAHRDRFVALGSVALTDKVDLGQRPLHERFTELENFAELQDVFVHGAKQQLVPRCAQLAFCSGDEAPVVSRIRTAAGKPYGSESPSVATHSSAIKIAAGQKRPDARSGRPVS